MSVCHFPCGSSETTTRTISYHNKIMYVTSNYEGGMILGLPVTAPEVFEIRHLAGKCSWFIGFPFRKGDMMSNIKNCIIESKVKEIVSSSNLVPVIVIVLDSIATKKITRIGYSVKPTSKTFIIICSIFLNMVATPTSHYKVIKAK